MRSYTSVATSGAKWLLLLPLLSVVFLPGCYYDIEEELYPNTFCDTVNVTYTGGISEIIQGKCALPGCHVAGGSGTGNFTVFDELLEQVNNGILLASIRHEPNAVPMPDGGKLSNCEIRRIELWVAAGAQNN